MMKRKADTIADGDSVRLPDAITKVLTKWMKSLEYRMEMGHHPSTQETSLLMQITRMYEGRLA